jgi:hypothetical protein
VETMGAIGACVGLSNSPTANLMFLTARICVTPIVGILPFVGVRRAVGVSFAVEALPVTGAILLAVGVRRGPGRRHPVWITHLIICTNWFIVDRRSISSPTLTDFKFNWSGNNEKKKS